jgi:hypothetical protein
MSILCAISFRTGGPVGRGTTAMPLDPGEQSKTSFYADLGFQSRLLTHDLVEMTLGSCTFLL